MLNHIITESIREDLSGQWWNRDPCRLPLQDIAKVFKVRVAPPYTAVAELEGGNIGATYDLVVGVHIAAHPMGAWILYLGWGKLKLNDSIHDTAQGAEQQWQIYLYLEKILRWSIDLFKALLSRVWHCLHDCGAVARSLVVVFLVLLLSPTVMKCCSALVAKRTRWSCEFRSQKESMISNRDLVRRRNCCRGAASRAISKVLPPPWEAPPFC